MQKKIIIYSMPNCIFCTNLKKWLVDNQISFEERCVTENEKFKQEFIELKGFGFPLILIQSKDKEHVITGFNQNSLESLLI